MINTVKNIYSHLQDDRSRQLFENRLLYTLTGDHKYMVRLIESMDQKKKLDQAVAFCKNHEDQTVLYGQATICCFCPACIRIFGSINSVTVTSKNRRMAGVLFRSCHRKNCLERKRGYM